jgi:2-iminobutanoate/2-iminopropanoate deaminase
MFEFHETTIAPLVECPTATGKSFWGAWTDLAASYAWRGQKAEAAAAVVELLKVRPDFTVETLAQDGSARSQHIVDGARTAGRLSGTLTPEFTENSRGGEGQPGARLGADRDPRLPRQRRLVMARIPIAPPGMKDQRPRYTLGWRVGNHIYVAGQLPFDKDGNLLGKGDIKAQTRRIFEQIKMIVEAGGGKMDDVVKVTVFVTDVRYREPYGEVRSEFFGPNPPASTLVQIGNLAIPDALIEIEAVAALDG